MANLQVNDHISAGMKTVYEVTEVPDSMAALAKLGDVQPKGVMRDYYVAAEKVLWDYAPLGGDACSGSLQPWSEAGAVRAENNATTGQIGSRRYRAIYVEYTDATFAVKKVSDAFRLFAPLPAAQKKQQQYADARGVPACQRRSELRYELGEGLTYNMQT